MAKKTKVTEDGEIVLADEMLSNEYPPFFKTPYNHDTLAEAYKSAIYFTEPSLTQQHERESCDINEIVRKFGIRDLAQRGGQFLDIPEDLDLQTTTHQVREAKQAWEALPANIRMHFETMENYIDFVDQSVAQGNRQVLQDLNLVNPLPDQPPPSKAAPRPSESDTGDSPAPKSEKPPPKGGKE